jgi:hypothetical protein
MNIYNVIILSAGCMSLANKLRLQGARNFTIWALSTRVVTLGAEGENLMREVHLRGLGVDLLTYLLTYSLTPWCRIFEKLIVTQLIKKYPFFMEPEG